MLDALTTAFVTTLAHQAFTDDAPDPGPLDDGCPDTCPDECPNHGNGRMFAGATRATIRARLFAPIVRCAGCADILNVGAGPGVCPACQEWEAHEQRAADRESTSAQLARWQREAREVDPVLGMVVGF